MTDQEELECPDGTFSFAGQQYCTACPAGYECSDKVTPTQCADGTYSDLFDGECHTCEVNHECIHGRKYTCPPSHYAAAGASECAPCPDGQTCFQLGAPVDCDPGYYASPLDIFCRPCPRGFECVGAECKSYFLKINN